MRKLKNKKAFTLIELIVVIAVLGVLVLLGVPKLLGHVQRAELTRIQHDVKVAENKMAEVLNDENDFVSWANNEKDLGALILRNQLYEKQGVARSVELTQANKSPKASNGQLGVGGLLNKIEPSASGESSDYKVIPVNLVKETGTKLKGTFYSNRLGKVYYEPNKPLKSIKQENVLNCVTAESLGYKFEIVNGKGTITGYNGNLTHLYIPSAFLIDGECVPVKVIATGAFKNGNFTKVTIPQSVKEIQPDAFKDGQLTEVDIPHSVTIIGGNSFSGNPIKTGGVTVNSPADSVNIGSGAFGTVTPTYKIPTSNDLKIIVETKVDSKGVKTGSIKGSYGIGGSGTFSSGSTGPSNGGSAGGGSGDSGSNTGSGSNGGSGSTVGSVSSGNYSNNVVSIPSKVVVNGETIVITEVAKGAYQGKGVIYVEFPDSLEIIEDYAFAGNQLIGVELPPNVKSVGNYAFAYNEIDGKRTLGYVKIPATNDYLDKINNVGNIELEGTKANKIGNASLLDHVFVFGNDFDIPETYNPIKNEVVEGGESDNNVYVMAKDSDFTGTKNGEFRYVGKDTYVEIPHVIKGVNITSYDKMFSDYYGAKTLNVKGVKSTNKNVKYMGYMFYESLATELKLSSFDTSNVEYMVAMFYKAQAKELDLSSFSTSNVTDMTSMFYAAQAKEFDLSSFDTSKVKYMGGMFNNSQAEKIDLSSFNTSNVTEMTSMFYEAQAKELNLSSFDTSRVESMNGMFNMSQVLILDLSSFNVTSVSNTHWMLFGVKTKIGYARTQSDANVLNNSSWRASTLVFTVKK